MRRSYRGKRTNTKITKEFRVNEKIFAPKVMIIDESGQQLGLMSREQALTEAKSKNLDLVEVSPKAEPPICKFMDYGSFKYQKEKQERKQKSKNKTVETKTIKVSTRIGQHDLEFRINQAIKFLNEGDKVKIEIQLRGRENQHADLARENIKKIITEIESKLVEKKLKTEQGIEKQGNRLSAIISL